MRIRKAKCFVMLGLLLLICSLAFTVEVRAKEKAASSTEIPIDGVHFPDEAFRKYISAYVDQNGDGMLSKAERDAVKWIGNVKSEIPKEYSVYKKKKAAELKAVENIRSFAGIELFENLREIQMQGTAVEELHLDNPKLQALWIKAEHLKFSMKNAKKLKFIQVEAAGEFSIDWDSVRNLVSFSASGGLHVPLNVLFQNKKLTLLNLTNVVIREKGEWPRAIDFSSLPLLKEVWLWNPGEEGQASSVESLDFGNNSALEGVYGAENGATKQLILPGKATYCEERNYYAHTKDVARLVEIKFKEEEALKGMKLPKGSVALSEENFPDVSFRVYLYRYADTNKDNILSKEEREAVIRIQNDFWNYEESYEWNDIYYFDTEPEFEDYERYTAAGRIASLKGIEYFPNLYEIQLKLLKLSPDVEEIVISNPKLKYLDLSFYGNVKKINLTGCKGLYMCHIFPNLGSAEKGSVTVDFTKVNSLTELMLNSNIDAFQAVSALPKKEKLHLLSMAKAPITEEDMALLSELTSLKDLELYAPEEIKEMGESSWLETLDLSKLQNLKELRFGAFQFTKGLLLPNKSVKVYCDYKDSLEITYAE